MRSPRLAIAIVLVSGCGAELALPDEAVVTCSSNNDCTNGRMCLAVIGQCVRAGDACVTVNGGNATADTDGNPCTLRNSGAGICMTGACIPPTCGDGIATLPEECDNGRAANSNAPGACRPDCTLPICGDAVIDPGEECVPGDVIGSNGRDICNPQCRYDFCGDGHLGPNEDCDDGNSVDTDACVGCRSASCGDGFVWLGVEACDDGNDVELDGCRECRLASCGNNAIDVSEVCDDGNDDDTDSCLSTCLAPSCGDGFLRTGVEECDLGSLNGQGGERCTAACANNVCGDGHRGPNEACDDGVRNGTVLSQCTASCAPANCGDGRLGAYEQCDEGAANGTATSACRPDCQRNSCGDANLGRGEQCDLGVGNGTPGASCTQSCLTNRCGDGHVGPGEVCDNGVYNGTAGLDCTAACQLSVCGDGHRGSAEQCDDGTANGTATSQCRPDCTAIICGDGLRDAPAEDCDLGLGVNGNGRSQCSTRCCTDTDNDEICDDEDLCFGNNAALDADDDAYCNDVDLCPASDDAVSADGDLTPDGCDAASTNASISTYGLRGVVLQSRQDRCDATLDTNGDGLLPINSDTSYPGVALSQIIAPMWRGGHSWADFFNGSTRNCVGAACIPWTAIASSPFGRYDIATTGGLTYMSFNQEVGLLAPGTYFVTVRLYNSANRSDWGVSASTRANRSCLTLPDGGLTWTAASQASNSYNVSPTLRIVITEDTAMARTRIGCPVTLGMFNDSFAFDKGGIAFDFIRVRKGCTGASDCNDGEATTSDTCTNSICEHRCQ